MKRTAIKMRVTESRDMVEAWYLVLIGITLELSAEF